MKIKQCQIENLTVFSKQNIDFCDGVNVFIGANGTGKSHLLKILYAMLQAVPGKPEAAWDATDTLRLREVVNGVFKPEDSDIALLIRAGNRKSKAVIHLESDRGHHYAELRPAVHDDSARAPRIEDAAGLFIPPNEVLAIYPGFTASYEKRELAFDQTYYDICKALAASPLKQKHMILSRVKNKLETHLPGEVKLKGDHFYLHDAVTGQSVEAHLLAEGHRKIAAVVHLINNGAIDKNTVLFWDEPEANLNPRLIKQIALFLRELAKVGIQIFIATHDYLLTGELSLAAEYPMAPKVPIRFFALSREGNKPVKIESGDTLADLRENPILDEFAAHYDREQKEVIRYVREGGSE